MRSKLRAVLQRFIDQEASSGILLFLAAVCALLLANSGFSGVYGRAVERVQAPVDDGLMTLFFLLVGLEIKREMVSGELRTVSSAVLPAIAAAGGMLVPGAIFAALNSAAPADRGWAIPMATDIAFSIGCLTLMKKRVPVALIVFLTALAIFDDIGGIAVIAVFYARGFSPRWLLATAAVGIAVWMLARRGARSFLIYAGAGVLMWIGLHRAGVHPTMAGVLLGVLVPRQLLDGWIEKLHRPVALGIVPLFALANSGVSLAGAGAADLLAPVALGVGLGLFAGKQLGIFLFTIAAVRVRIAPMPGGASLRQLHGVAVVGGIGFTVALFIAELAFAAEPALLREAKIGILAGSLLSGIVGALLLRTCPAVPTAARQDLRRATADLP